MSSGKVHLQALKVVAPFALVGSVSLAVLSWDVDPLWAIAGYALGFLVDPDLDQIGITSSEARMLRTVFLAPLIGWWSLYAYIFRMFGGHRSFWTHVPGISTIIRLCFGISPIVFVLMYFGYLPNSLTAIPFLYILLGLTVADTVHFVLDILNWRGNGKE